jgi:hypothetical protein
MATTHAQTKARNAAATLAQVVTANIASVRNNGAAPIHSRALLVWLTIRTWSARKYDRKVSADVNKQYAASTDAGRYNKFLLPGDAAAYKTLTALATSVRTEHYSNTLAWSDEGWRLLPTANYTRYTDWLRAQQTAFASALDSFADDYPRLRQQARASLGNLYRDDDYPSVMDIRSRFELSVQFSPLPAAGDVRVDLDATQIADIAANITNTQQKAVTAAMSDAWSRLHDVVTKIHERLSVPDAIFRDSLIGNARDICDALTRLNITGDAQLEAMRARVLQELTTVEPDVLRDTPRARQQVADKADAILSAMSGILS